MKKLASLALLLAPLSTVPALAQQPQQDSRTYFTARVTQRATPQQLSQADRDYYDRLFGAIEREAWSEVQALFAERPSGLLHDVARAEYYLAANSPRVELDQITQWLATGAELPQAEQLARLGQTRGLAEAPRLPYARDHARRHPRRNPRAHQQRRSHRRADSA